MMRNTGQFAVAQQHPQQIVHRPICQGCNQALVAQPASHRMMLNEIR